MGERGPAPKRSDMVRRRNKPDIEVTKGQANPDTEAPDADAEWHPVAKRWYESLARSGQSFWYEPSDWALAYMIAESISRDLKPQFVAVSEATGKPIYESIPMKGASLAAYLRAMTALLVTEGDRRRSRVELQRGEVDDSAEREKVARMDAYRAAAGR